MATTYNIHSTDKKIRTFCVQMSKKDAIELKKSRFRRILAYTKMSNDGCSGGVIKFLENNPKFGIK